MTTRPSHRIWILAQPPLIRSARLFVAGVARRYGSTEAVVEDLKLAVAEAVNLAMASGAARVEIDVSPGPDGLRVTARPGGGPSEDPIDGFEVIAALFPDATRSLHEVAFTVPVAIEG